MKNGAYKGDEKKWQAVLAKDLQADGHFFYSVKSTGVYCFPSCKSRPALRKNIAFHNTPQDAEKHGFRPCKRCSPNGPNRHQEQTASVERACRLIHEAEILPTLEALAKAVGMSPFHFHRTFKTITGVTPKKYSEALRSNRVREQLTKNSAVTHAIYDSGFNSNGRFYAKSSEILGMTPTQFKKGGAGETIQFALGECSLGYVLVGSSEKGVCAIFLGDDPDVLIKELQDRFQNARLIPAEKKFQQTIARVVGFIESPKTGLDLPLDIRGTAFQQRVWQALQKIPLGKTVSYTEIARRIGMAPAVRAVAGACAANHIALAIPCHRVVRSDGNLSGYRWGVERKKALLKSEAAD